MRKTLYHVFQVLSFNIKTLLLFIITYRVIGILLIFPISRFVFSLSIRLSGSSYINNLLLVDYLLSPSTILLLILLLLLFTVYFAIELIFLSILFDVSHHEQKIDFIPLIRYGVKRILPILKRYHVALIVPSLFFVIIVEIAHIVGIASTIRIPDFVLTQIGLIDYLDFAFYGLIVLMFFFLMESSLAMHSYITDGYTIKHTFQKNRQLLKQRRLKHILTFVIINLLINGLLYAIYTLIIFIIGGLVWITRGEPYVLGFLLTILYTLYILFVFISSLILVPINYALFSGWYYESKATLGEPINWLKFKKIIRQPFSNKRFKQVFTLTFFVLFLFNITAVFTTVTTPNDQIELFSYAQIVAHRGASQAAPENTLAAIERAIEEGADAVEFDVRLTRDLVPILMHDATLRRTTGDLRRVEDVTYEEIASLDAGRWFHPDFIGEPIPTLDQALSFIEGRVAVFIELKVNNIALERQTIDYIASYGLENDVVILSFYRDQLSRIKALEPRITTLLLMTSFIGDEIALLNHAEVDIYGFEFAFISSRLDLIDRIHNSGKQIYVWTLSSESHIQSATQLDFDGLITSLPGVARELEYAKNRDVEFIDLLRSLFEPRR